MRGKAESRNPEFEEPGHRNGVIPFIADPRPARSASPRSASDALVTLGTFDEFDGLTDFLDLFGRFIGNADVEFFLEFHH